MEQIVESNNNFLNDDQLISLIKSNFNKDDMKLFELNYKLYIENKNNPDGFIVNFDEVYKCIGFSRKDNAKRLLESENNKKENIFHINKDYIIKMNKPIASAIAEAIKSKGGENKEYILLTINCFKKFCLKASTELSEKIFDYYIKMEEIIIKYIENKHNEIIDNNKKLLELKDKETNNILELKNVENNKLLQLKNQEIKNKEKLLELKDKEIENKDKLLVETTHKKSKIFYVLLSQKRKI
jgi:hypothetical protein